MTTNPARMAKRLHRLERLYPATAAETASRIEELLSQYGPLRTPTGNRLWSERDAVLITYGDQIRAADEPPLQTLRRFLVDHRLTDCVNTVHLLPCFPYTSDDGFSVSDYKSINPNLGSWDDVKQLGQQVELMFDLVLNHCSQQHAWFQRFLAGEPPYDRYFVTADPASDLSRVTRPRSHPLLTPFPTSRGTQHVWTTFSADQVDLNFASPDVLLAMLDVLLFYVQQGARIIRLDAIAYLWKQIGTSCIHQEQTHEIVKLLRDVLETVAPGVLLITETNVPHQENVSYFGDGDEAHLVYQFSLAPLLLDALLCGDARPLDHWLKHLEPPPPGTTYFNFTASHDGVGVRPLEGLVDPSRLARLVDAVRDRGGFISLKRNADGTESPYELNITYFSALGGAMSADRQIGRFLASQALMLALQGIPGIYFHSLLGTPNDSAGVARTGRARTINRRRFTRAELEAQLQDDDVVRKVFAGYRHLLAVRRRQPAFDPAAAQQVIPSQHPSQLGFWRTTADGDHAVLVLANLGEEDIWFDLQAAGAVFPSGPTGVDLLTDELIEGPRVPLRAESVRWLRMSSVEGSAGSPS